MVGEREKRKLKDDRLPFFSQQIPPVSGTILCYGRRLTKIGTVSACRSAVILVIDLGTPSFFGFYS
jgi:hypothetical protein